MNYLKIEKFIGDQHEITHKIPFFLFRIVTCFLPKKAIIKLVTNGINIQEILTASAKNMPYNKMLCITEKNISKRIVISIV